MSFYHLAFAAFFLFITTHGAPHGAPAGNADSCAELRITSLDLNHVTKTASLMARNGSTDLASFSSSIAWMEAKDMCDPESLKQKSKHCVSKIFSVLTSYNSAVERISAFESCSEFTKIVKPALTKLQRNMGSCLSLEEPHVSKEDPQPIHYWKEAFLCRYTLDRLFSFSILTARVFAVGDPSHHPSGTVQKCI